MDLDNTTINNIVLFSILKRITDMLLYDTLINIIVYIKYITWIQVSRFLSVTFN
jgi:hypothetical protein